LPFSPDPPKVPTKKSRSAAQLAANQVRRQKALERSKGARNLAAKRAQEVLNARLKKDKSTAKNSTTKDASEETNGAESPNAPSPDIPSPEVPSPEVPSPEVPSPEVPSPEVPSPEIDENNSMLLNDTQPTLMRIGSDSASEYIELKGGQFKSLGGFEVVSMGLGTKEFKKLYNIKTAEQFSTMQRVFGVARLGGKPRVWTYLEQACEFDGIATVIAALKFRSKTLQAAIQLNVDSNVSKRYKHLKAWIDETVAKLSSAKGPCPTPLTTKVNVAVGPNVSGGPKNTGSGGPSCPCLTDINLLRDLVYVMALARGNASPEIRKQIEAIPINSILEAAAGNNATKMYPGMKATLIEIIKILRSASVAVKNGDLEELPQDILKTIYKALATPEMKIPESITLEDVLGLITDIQNALDGYKHDLEETKGKEADCEEQDAEVVYLRALKEELEGKLQSAQGILGGVDEIVGRLQQQVAELTAQTKECQDQKAEQEAQIAALNAEIQRILSQKGAEQGAAADAHAASLTAKQEEVDALSAAVQTMGDHITALTAELQRMKAVAAEVDDLRAQLAACQEEKGSLTDQLTAATARVSDLEGELAELARASMSNKNKGNTAAQKLKTDLDAAKQQVADLTAKQTQQEAQIAALAQQVAGQITEMEQLRARILELQVEKERADREKARANAAETAGLAKNTQINQLKKNVQNVKASLADREASMAVAAAELAAVRAALTTQKEQSTKNTAAAKQEFETQLAQEKAKLADCDAAAEATKEQHAKDLAALNEQLSAAKSTLSDLEGLAEKTKGEKAATQGQLDAALAKVAALEGQIASMSTTGAEQQSSFEAERKGFRDRIASLEAEVEGERQKASGTEATLKKEISDLGARISALQQQHAAEMQSLKDEQATKNRAAKAEQNTKASEAAAAAKAALDAKSAELNQLKTELAAKQVQLGAITEKNAAIAAKNAIIAQQIEQLGENDKALEELRIKETALTAKITQLETQLASLQSEVNMTKSQRGTNVALADSLKKKLAAALEQKRTNDAQIQKLQTNLIAAPKRANFDILTEQLSTAQGKITDLTTKLQEVEAAKTTEVATTSAALQNALAELAVSKEQQDALAKAAKGDMSGLQNIKKETCDFFFFLYDTINLQLRNIQKMNIPAELKKDIFTMYNLPASYSSISQQDMLNELSLVFQEFFYKFNTLTGAGGKGMQLSGKYPVLKGLISNIKLDAGRGACSLKAGDVARVRDDLSRIGYQYDFAVKFQGKEDTTLVIGPKPSSDICSVSVHHISDHFIPLSVLAIRMIQLLHETFEGRYKELKTRCLPSEISDAVEVRPAEDTA
jgi:chromosome segregation ATPase